MAFQNLNIGDSYGTDDAVLNDLSILSFFAVSSKGDLSTILKNGCFWLSFYFLMPNDSLL